MTRQKARSDDTSLVILKYHELDDVLTRLGALCGAAEAHGTFCGLFCSAPRTARQQYLDNIIGVARTDDPDIDQCREVLDRMMQESSGLLAASQLAFELILPDDVEALDLRTTALAHWCQAFLTGLTDGGLNDLDAIPEDARELVGDFSDITRAGIDEDQNQEEAEKAYAELVEYVRVGVQVIFEELNALKSPQAGVPAHLH
ncbi:MAG: UPF0149 family protein [Gammaproteobacteria bacterium]